MKLFKLMKSINYKNSFELKIIKKFSSLSFENLSEFHKSLSESLSSNINKKEKEFQKTINHNINSITESELKDKDLEDKIYTMDPNELKKVYITKENLNINEESNINKNKSIIDQELELIYNNLESLLNNLDRNIIDYNLFDEINHKINSVCNLIETQNINISNFSDLFINIHSKIKSLSNTLYFNNFQLKVLTLNLEYIMILNLDNIIDLSDHGKLLSNIFTDFWKQNISIKDKLSILTIAANLNEKYSVEAIKNDYRIYDLDIKTLHKMCFRILKFRYKSASKNFAKFFIFDLLNEKLENDILDNESRLISYFLIRECHRKGFIKKTELNDRINLNLEKFYLNKETIIDKMVLKSVENNENKFYEMLIHHLNSDELKDYIFQNSKFLFKNQDICNNILSYFFTKNKLNENSFAFINSLNKSIKVIVAKTNLNSIGSIDNLLFFKYLLEKSQKLCIDSDLNKLKQKTDNEKTLYNIDDTNDTILSINDAIIKILYNKKIDILIHENMFCLEKIRINNSSCIEIGNFIKDFFIFLIDSLDEITENIMSDLNEFEKSKTKNLISKNVKIIEILNQISLININSFISEEIIRNEYEIIIKALISNCIKNMTYIHQNYNDLSHYQLNLLVKNYLFIDPKLRHFVHIVFNEISFIESYNIRDLNVKNIYDHMLNISKIMEILETSENKDKFNYRKDDFIMQIKYIVDFHSEINWVTANFDLQNVTINCLYNYLEVIKSMFENMKRISTDIKTYNKKYLKLIEINLNVIEEIICNSNDLMKLDKFEIYTNANKSKENNINLKDVNIIPVLTEYIILYNQMYDFISYKNENINNNHSQDFDNTDNNNEFKIKLKLNSKKTVDKYLLNLISSDQLMETKIFDNQFLQNKLLLNKMLMTDSDQIIKICMFLSNNINQFDKIILKNFFNKYNRVIGWKCGVGKHNNEKSLNTVIKNNNDFIDENINQENIVFIRKNYIDILFILDVIKNYNESLNYKALELIDLINNIIKC